MAGGRRERGAHDLEPGSAAQHQPELDAGAAGPGPSVPAGVLVLELRGWHPAFGAPPIVESPRMPSFAEIAAIRFAARMRAEAGADCVPGLRCDERGRGGDLAGSDVNGSSQAHRPRPSRPWLASGAAGAAAVPGPARSAGADELSPAGQPRRRQGRAETPRQGADDGWLDSGADLSRSPHGEPPRAVSGDVGGLAVAVLSAAGLLWLSLMTWAWWG
jgi:hypothetical protein